MFSEPIPTPLLAFAVPYHQAGFGVMVTASHNPKQDNGYKVYGPAGCQIVAPDDRNIATRIAKYSEEQLPDLDGVPLHTTGWQEVFAAYSAAILSSTSRYAGGAALDYHEKIVYTPVHGVGQVYIDRLLADSGLCRLIPVPSQSAPDPDFSTVKFPNPEEGLAVLVYICKCDSLHSCVGIGHSSSRGIGCQTGLCQ